MKLEKSSLFNSYMAVISFLIFAVFTIWWFLIDPFNPTSANENARTAWSSIYQIFPYLGAINGLFVAKKWGGYKSVLGRSILAFSIGLLCQAVGQSIYVFYMLKFHIPVPYPSWAEVFYFSTIPFYIYGTILLVEASGVKISLKSYLSKIQALLIPLAMLSVSYLLFFQSYILNWSNPAQIFLDFGYPIGQAIYVSLAILVFSLSREFLGGVMRLPIFFLLIALVSQYITDYFFSYQFNAGNFYVGCFSDYMYLFSYFLMTMALFNLDSVFEKNKNN